MRRLLFAIALLCPALYGQITFDNAVNHGALATTGHQISATINAVSGEFLVASFEFTGNGSACATAMGTVSTSDTAANTWAQVGTGFISAGNFNCMQMWYAQVATGNAADVVTFSWSAVNNQEASIVVSEYVNVATSSPLDASATGTGVASPFQTGLFTTTNAGDLVVCSGGNYYGNSFTGNTIGATTATIPTNGINGTNSTAGGNAAHEYVIETSTQTSIRGKMSVGTGNVSADIVCAAFLPSGGGPPPAVLHQLLTLGVGK